METPRPATREQLNHGEPTIPRQAAAVVLLRDTGAEPGMPPPFELLLVQRNPAQHFMGGYWVFPGGAVDEGEGEGDVAHRAAAVRELREEAGVGGVDPAELVKYSRWITPELLRTRFDTHFFLARAPDGVSAHADGRECVDLRWGTPRALLDAHHRDELALVFPTIRQLEQLSGFASIEGLLTHMRAQPIVPMLPRIVRTGEVARPYLPGEPGYDAG
jgi:8-oxo-dGTP pyrophosphatase MutT (NUDIX family)